MRFHGEQDIRRNGCIKKYFSSYVMQQFLFSSCSLCGISFYLRFLFLKMLFLKILLFVNLPGSWLALFLCCFWLLCLLQHYSVRLIVFSFFWCSSVVVNKLMNMHMKTLIFSFCIPLVTLSFFSIFIGYLSKVFIYWL